MSKRCLIVLSISLALNLILGYLLLMKKSEVGPVPEIQEYIEKIDSLNSELDTIKERRDVVRERIDTVYVEIERTKVIYEKARNTIINNTTDDNLLFFREYLKRRRDSIDHL